MKKFIMWLFKIKCETYFTPPPTFIMPQVDAPEINRCQYYCYNYFGKDKHGKDWYGRVFYCNGNVEYLRLAEAPPLQQWLHIYPLPMDIDYVNEFSK